MKTKAKIFGIIGGLCGLFALTAVVLHSGTTLWDTWNYLEHEGPRHRFNGVIFSIVYSCAIAMASFLGAALVNTRAGLAAFLMATSSVLTLMALLPNMDNAAVDLVWILLSLPAGLGAIFSVLGTRRTV